MAAHGYLNVAHAVHELQVQYLHILIGYLGFPDYALEVSHAGAVQPLSYTPFKFENLLAKNFKTLRITFSVYQAPFHR